jgi:RNA methyltransferase, TrmH family
MVSKNRIKFIQSLCHKKERDLNQLFFAEGDKIVKEILKQNLYRIETIYGTLKWQTMNAAFLQEKSFEVVTEEELQKLSALKTANEAIAVLHYKEPSIIPNPNEEFVLAIDNIQDPGNLGTIIRICDWFGVQYIICNNNTVDMYNPKVIQATMGSFLRVKMVYLDLYKFIVENKIEKSFAATMNGKPYKEMKSFKNGLLIIGNEGNGIEDKIIKLVQNKITIPKIGEAESLNASVATGILLSHFME